MRKFGTITLVAVSALAITAGLSRTTAAIPADTVGLVRETQSADDRGTRGQGSDDLIVSNPTVEPGDDKGGQGEVEPGDDRGGQGEVEPGDDKSGQGEVEPGDDKGGQGEVEPGDDKGSSTAEPGDDKGSSTAEPGDDNGGHHSGSGSGSDDSGHHGGGHD